MERTNIMSAIVVFLVFASTYSETFYGSNLDDHCIRCLCYAATECKLSLKCEEGYCGAFKISRVYWIEAGKTVLPDDDPSRGIAWQDCAIDYHCAKRIVEGYMKKFGRDCNNDGITDCYDYMMIHYNGGYGCSTPLNATDNGQIWVKRYEQTCA